MPTLLVNGARLYYEEHGARPGPGTQTLVFAHGVPWSGRSFDAQVAELTTPWPGERAAPCRCITFDFRGHGRSEGTADGHGLDTLTDDAAALVEALGAARCHFVGVSMGGLVGIRLAVRRPELLGSLVLIDPGLPGAARRGTGRERLNDDLARIAVPTLVVVGGRDAAAAAAGAERIAGRIPDARRVAVPGAGHTAGVEEPDFVSRALANFLQTYWIARELSRAAWTAVERVREMVLASVPEAGGFAPAAAEVPIEGRRYAAVTFRVEVGADPASAEWPLRVTATLAAPATGRHASRYVVARDRAHLLDQVDRGRLANHLSWFLEREAREVADPTPYPPAMIAAGTHAALPSGPDCERFRPDALPGEVGVGETLFESSHHDLRLLHCEHCGQVFVYVFMEVWDDGWGFAARVSEEEAALVRRDRSWATPLIESRRHLVWPPRGAAHWATGPEHVLQMGPRA